MALTFFTTNQLLKLGFHFPDYEHLCEEGMTYWYNETEYVIGGGDGQPYTAFDQKLAEKGTWLPNAEQLMEWLQRNDFDVIIHWNDAMQWFDVHATDMQARVRFDAGGGDLCNSLGKLIQKICKANYRDLTPRPVECLEIISEDTEAVSLSDLIQTILFDGGQQSRPIRMGALAERLGQRCDPNSLWPFKPMRPTHVKRKARGNYHNDRVSILWARKGTSSKNLGHLR